jgi:hypothetical protein
MIKRLLAYVLMLIIGLIFDFCVMAKNVVFDAGYRASVFSAFRQVALFRLISRTMAAMAHWINKVSDKSYVLLFGGKKDFTMLYGHAFR